MPNKLTTKEFIKKANLKHDSRWNYSKSIYNGSKNKLTIICEKHGEFIQKASDHLSGCGCPDCDPTKRLGLSKFIEKSILKHGDKWDYSKVKYGKNNYDLVEIICEKHGSFMQRPWAHLRGQGCPDCSNNKLITNKEFIKRSIKKHGDKYDYSLVDYKGRKKYVNIMCKKHGVFNQMASLHLEGFGCKKCKSSKLEDYFSKKLNEIKEPFEVDKRFEDCINKKPLPFDFYLPLRNTLIECDGIQHREPIEYFGGEERLKYQKKNDKIKTEWCNTRNIKLVRLNNNSEINKFIEEINKSEIPFDKSVLKDVSLDRFEPVKDGENDYLCKTDFNWYKERNIKKEISDFIDSLGVSYETNNEFDWIIDDNFIILIDNFRDCEINKNKKWLANLKDELEEKDINLIAIFPELWISKPDIIKSRIKNLLKQNEFKIGARKCKIIEPDNKSCKKFLNENHIQGFIGAKIKIGLYYKEELVSLMTFGKLRKNLGQTSKKDSYELLRFCNRKGYSIVGSANKLMKHFIKTYKPKYVLSYADRCWSSTHKNVYKQIGLNFVNKTDPSYFYLVGDKKYGRFKYRKDRLVEFGYKKEKWTERSICSSNSVFRIFDAGCLKYDISFNY